MIPSACGCSLPLLMALLVVATAAASLDSATATKSPHSAHMRPHRDGSIGAAACMGPSLSQLPSLPLPNYNVPASIERNLTDGGRTDVHGWLMLPWDRPASTPDSVPISAWFYHHTPSVPSADTRTHTRRKKQMKEGAKFVCNVVCRTHSGRAIAFPFRGGSG